jgi:tRNA(Ile)-lysidine synthase
MLRMNFKKWTAFEHQVKKDLSQSEVWDLITGKHLVVAVSGGADSVATLVLCLYFQKLLKNKISVLHLHHGKGGNIKFREQAQKLVTRLCKGLNVDLVVQKNSGLELKSEEQMRNFRFKHYQKCLKDLNADYVVTGHNSNDLLETRVMRLIRGTGISGVKSMTHLDGHIFRPLLSRNRSEIENYLELRSQKFIEDPSNQDTHYLRNWLRHKWIPDLEKHVPGGVMALSRSLDLIVKSTSQAQVPKDVWSHQGISRVEFASLASNAKKMVLVEFLKKHKMKHFRHTQIEEIIKQLDKRQIEHKFDMLGLCWVVNAEQITIEL